MRKWKNREVHSLLKGTQQELGMQVLLWDCPLALAESCEAHSIHP